MKDNKIFNDIKQRYWDRKFDEALALAETLNKELDLDDDDDIIALSDMIADAVLDHAHFDMLRYWMNNGYDINCKPFKHDSLILRAADKCVSPEIFQFLVDNGADAYSENSKGDNVLLLSAKRTFSYSFDKNIAETLPVYIARNFDLTRLDKTDNAGATPLIYAVEYNKSELVKALVERGADVNGTGSGTVGCGLWTTYNGVTPLAVACRNGLYAIAEYLISVGADESIADMSGLTPIFHLLKYPFGFLRECRYGSPIFEEKCRIIALFKNLDAIDSRGNTPLIASLSERDTVYVNQPITHALIERGANAKVAANNGWTALHFAAKNRLFDTVKALVLAGVDVNAQNNDGATALHLACNESDEKTARYLLKKGADYSLQDNSGKSAMEIATVRGLNDVIELML